MAKCELHGNLLRIIPTVTDKHAFIIILLPPFRPFFLNTGILAGGPQGTVGKGYRHGEGQFSGRIDCAGEHIHQRMSAFRAAIPALHDGIYFAGPGHGNGRSGNIHHDERFTRGGKRFNERILPIREDDVFAVCSFVVLVFTLVQSADIQDAAGVPAGGDGVSKKLLRTPAFAKILASPDLVVDRGRIAYVAALPDHLGVSVEDFMQGIERSHLILGLEVGGAAAHHHHLIGIFPDDQQFTSFRKCQRQRTVVPEEDKSVGRNLTGGGEMLR